MKNESVKKSLEKSKNVLEEKRKMVKHKTCIKKTNTFTIIFFSIKKHFSKICLVGEIMVKIISKFSRFSESFLAISLVPTNHHGAHAIEYLPFICSQKPSQSRLQNFVIINPHNRIERNK